MNPPSVELLQTLTKRAQSHYSNTLPYHNWEHAAEVMKAAARIGLTSKEPQVADNAHLLTIAAAWHDADYHLDTSGVFQTKEENSAYLALTELPELSLSDRQLIASAIVDTTVSKHPKESLLGEALHMADLGYFAADSDQFHYRLGLMRQEWGKPTWAETRERTRLFGSHVIKEVGKTAFEILPEADAKAWMTAIQRNLDSLS